MTRSEECREMLRTLLDGIRNHDDPKNTIIEDCSPDSARFVLNLAIAMLGGVEAYMPITCSRGANNDAGIHQIPNI